MSRRSRTTARTAPRSQPTPAPRGGSRIVLVVVALVVLVGVGVGAMMLVQGQRKPAAVQIPAPDLTQLEPRVARSITEAQEGIMRAPTSTKAWGKLGAILDAHGLDALAGEAYRQAQQLDPREFRWPYNLACIAIELDEPLEVIEALFDEARSLNPGHAALDCRLGDALSSSGRTTDAVAAYRRSLAIDDTFAMAHRGLGMVLLSIGDIDAAVVHLERAAAAMPSDGVSASALAQAYGRARRTEQATAVAARARNLERIARIPDVFRDEVAYFGTSAALCSARAARLIVSGQIERAIEQLLIVEETRPDDPYIQIRLGMCFMQLGRSTEAMSRFSKAIEIKPDFAEPYVEMGRLRSAAGDLQGALAAYERALAIDPNLVSAHAKMGNALVRLGRTAEALTHFEAADQLGELDAESLTNWAVGLQQVGRNEEALARCATAVERQPGYARGHYGLGFICSEMGRDDEAIGHYRSTIAADPKFADAYYNLALSCERLGRMDEAIAAVRALLQIAPTPEATAKLARLEAAQHAEATAAGISFIPQRPEFEAVARQLTQSEQPYFGRRTAERLRQQLSDVALTATRRAVLLTELAQEQLEIGDVEGAIESIQTAFAIIDDIPGVEPTDDMWWQRAVVYLRKAEVENCIVRHNSECCVFPLQGGGVHSDTAPAEAAWASLTRFLELHPHDLGGRWLLNIVAMALGRYPAAVPPALQIPPESFASSRDVGVFVDIAPRLGIAAFNLCGGVVADDLTGDGLIDIATSSYDPEEPVHLFANSGDGRFIDLSSTSRVDDQLGGLNIVGADYDSDGDVDLLVLRGAWLLDDGRIRNSLLRNDGGVFTDVTREAGIARPAYPTQAAVWADFDHDGHLDVFIGNESRAQWDVTGNFPAQLFMNNGDGTFVDRAQDAGVTNDRYCKGVTAGDYDNDGDMDLYVSNSGPNRLYRNNGDGTFADVAPALGVVEPAGRSFATWFFDYDNDGWLDLFVGAFDAGIGDIAADYLGLQPEATRPRLYHNRGDGTFTDVAEAAGLGHMYLPMGANFGDIDNDGFLDIYLTTGDPEYETLTPNIMLHNTGKGGFEDVTQSSGLGHLQKGHGVAFADFDHDGDQDIYNQLGGFYPGDKYHNTLYLNPGHGHHFVTLELVGTTSNRMAYGARIRVDVDTPAGPREIHRAVGVVSSFGGSPARQEIGLGNATAITHIEVTWPTSGRHQTFTDVSVDSWVRITEDRDDVDVIQRRRITWK